MAEQKDRVEKKSVKQLTIVGPNSTKGEKVLRFHREDERKGYIDLLPGQTLKVGEDITASEAKTLTGFASWEIKEGVE
ncbi:MAG: hypothetical protein ACI35R_17450 [Bacillus sp. (in: firmicutes)]